MLLIILETSVFNCLKSFGIDSANKFIGVNGDKVHSRSRLRRHYAFKS